MRRRNRLRLCCRIERRIQPAQIRKEILANVVARKLRRRGIVESRAHDRTARRRTIAMSIFKQRSLKLGFAGEQNPSQWTSHSLNLLFRH